MRPAWAVSVAEGATRIVGWAYERPLTAEMVEEYLLSHPLPPALAHDPLASWRWGVRQALVGALRAEAARRRGLASTAGLAEHVADQAGADDGMEAQDLAAVTAANANLRTVPELRLVDHVLVEGAEEAQEVAGRVAAGEDLAALARRFSLDLGSRAGGGRIGWVAPGELTGAFEEACFAAQVGAVTGPVRSPFGWHVLVVRQVRRPRAPDEAELTAVAARQVRLAARAQAHGAWLSGELRDHVRALERADHPSQPWSTGRSHRH